jgi:stage II sporulation protein AA (anti-sigma F factor antagonist)
LAPHVVITEQRFRDVVVLSLKGQLIADDQDVQFRNAIDALVREGITKIVADLHDVTLLDSGGVGVLVAKFLTLRKRGGDLRLARLTERTRRVLAITRLLRVFATFDSPADAVHSFAVDAPHPSLLFPPGSTEVT